MAGKYSAPKKSHWAPFVVILAVAALVATIGGSMAWLTDSQGGLTNTFTPAKIYIEVKEDFNDNVKSNVYVVNGTSEKPSEADVYIRAAIVANWQDADGNVLAAPAVAGTDYSLDLNVNRDSAGWIQQGDYYYCIKANGNCTDVLINECRQLTEKTGYNLVVTVLAQAIQAEPATAVTNAWGASIPAGLAKIAASN